MTLLVTLLFVLALLVLLAGGLIHPCVIPPDAPRTLPGRQGDLPRPAPGNRDSSEEAEDDIWWRDWWIYAD